MTQSFEELRDKFFLSDDNVAVWQEWMGRGLDAALKVFRNRMQSKVCSDIPLTQLEAIFSATEVPESPEPLEAVFSEAVTNILKHSIRTNDPRFIGHMTGATPYVSLLVDMLISALNQNVVKIETALSASFVEKQTIAWLHRMVYGRDSEFYKNVMHRVDVTLGNTTGGGTLGNLTALAVARNVMLPEAASEGMVAAMQERGVRRVVILASKRVHYSVRKAAQVLGIGTKNVIELPVVPGSNRLDLAALESLLRGLEKHKTAVLAIVGVAGSTETGSIDNLRALGRLAKNQGSWFHVDAAWGGPILLSSTHRALLDGIADADSVVLDGHKFFYLTLSHGAVLFKNENVLDSIRHSANYIIRPGSADLGRTSLEGTRRFESLKLWFFLKTIGRQGYAELVDNSFALTRGFAEQIRQSPRFELTSEPETNILTYRFVPAGWKHGLERLKCLLLEQLPKSSAATEPGSEIEESLECLRFAAEFLNDVNVELQKRQRLAGRSFVSRTILESVYPGFETVVLRVVLMNPFTTSAILAEILAEQEQIGTVIVGEKWKKSAVGIPRRFAEFFGTMPEETF
jgi:putative pyridoxal-dependent aspartate 1-decarboxylase